METFDESPLKSDEQLELLSKLFGSYKAEWLQDSLFELYSEPSYFPELTTTRPCVLNGGRGTGKTTVLRSLSYVGQWEILKRKFPNFTKEQLSAEGKKFEYFGFYYRANTYRLAAFQGSEISKEEWQKIFLHYFNILFSIQLLKFLEWYKTEIADLALFSIKDINNICDVLNVERASNFDQLSSSLNKVLIDIESYINNIGIDSRPRLSSSGALDNIFNIISEVPEFKNKTFFLIIDEYENFRDEQQQVVNTLIKHTSTSYTFKIGVRKLGWRVRNTLNENENLISPADYVLIDIANKLNTDEFNLFAEEVCNSRINKLFENNPNAKYKTVKALFPELSIDQEAELLGVSEIAVDLRQEVILTENADLIKFTDEMKDSDLWVVKYLADGANQDFIIALNEMKQATLKYNKIEEYKYASLFSLRAKKSGIKKYYAGWNVFSLLAAVNIRYLLELVEQTLLLHYKREQSFNRPISYETQTTAAQFVGKKNLEELEGLTTYGGMLTKLVLGFGRIFNTLAANSGGHAHEVNQFRIRYTKIGNSAENFSNNGDNNAVNILNAAVMHLAILTFPGNKPKELGDTKENTYQLHPIFAPYFIFSHRKRRALIIDEEHIVGLIDSPKETIKKILLENNRTLSDNLPEQLKLFSSYYDI